MYLLRIVSMILYGIDSTMCSSRVYCIMTQIFFTKFLEGKSPPDFAAEDYEINYKGRVKLEDLSLLAKNQLALEKW